MDKNGIPLPLPSTPMELILQKRGYPLGKGTVPWGVGRKVITKDRNSGSKAKAFCWLAQGHCPAGFQRKSLSNRIRDPVPYKVFHPAHQIK